MKKHTSALTLWEINSWCLGYNRMGVFCLFYKIHRYGLGGHLCGQTQVIELPFFPSSSDLERELLERAIQPPKKNSFRTMRQRLNFSFIWSKFLRYWVVDEKGELVKAYSKKNYAVSFLYKDENKDKNLKIWCLTGFDLELGSSPCLYLFFKDYAGEQSRKEVLFIREDWSVEGKVREALTEGFRPAGLGCGNSKNQEMMFDPELVPMWLVLTKSNEVHNAFGNKSRAMRWTRAANKQNKQ